MCMQHMYKGNECLISVTAYVIENMMVAFHFPVVSIILFSLLTSATSPAVGLAFLLAHLSFNISFGHPGNTRTYFMTHLTNL